MFTIHCHHCDRDYLLGSGSIASIHNTSDGPIAYTKCPNGHNLIRYFRTSSTATLEQPALRAVS